MLLQNKNSLTNLKQLKEIKLCGEGDIIKANIDIEKCIIHIGKEAHCEMENDMINDGSQRGDLAGINIFIDSLIEGEIITKNMIEFSSMINYDINRIRIKDLRASNYIKDENTQNKIMEILNQWLVQ